MSEQNLRSVSLSRTSRGHYEATNTRGTTLAFGTGQTDLFTPVELLLTAIAGCSAVDVDFITSKRSEPTRFAVRMTGEKVRDDSGNHLENLTLTFDISFPDDEGGAAAVAVLPRAVEQSHDRLCTVSRTVQIGAPIDVRVAEA